MLHKSCPTIGYLVETFPQPPNAPIIKDILDLERQGLSLHVFSLRLPHQRDHLSTALKVQSPVTYIPSMLPNHIPEDEEALISAHVDLMRQNSQGHFKALDLYLSRPEGKQLNELLQAGYVALQLQQWGISHLHVPCENVPTATAELIKYISGVSYSITADVPELHQIDPQILARRVSEAAFILTSSHNHRSYLQEIVMDPPPIHVLEGNEVSAAAKATTIGKWLMPPSFA